MPRTRQLNGQPSELAEPGPETPLTLEAAEQELAGDEIRILLATIPAPPGEEAR